MEKLGDRIVVENERIPKNKYIKIIKDKKKIQKKLKVKQLPYPKGDIKYYTDGNSEYDNFDGIKKDLGGIFDE